MFQKIVVTFFLATIITFLGGCKPDEPKDPEIVLGKPVANAASNVTVNNFYASWTRVYNAQSYRLDVSASNNFNSFIDGYNGKIVNASFETVIGLLPNTTYYYRVKAVAANVMSDYSNIIEVKTPIDITPNLTLKGLATNYFIGAAVQSGKLTGDYNTVLNKEFSSLTSEYEMKMNIMMPTQASYEQKAYNFSPGDAIVTYANANSMNVHGHALIWHASTPAWIQNFSGSDTDFETIIKTYITDVVTHYKGKVNAWDVVNEAMEDGSNSFRNTVFYKKLGTDYIAKCCQWVHDADPNVMIFYNDYNLESDLKKRDAAFAMIDNLISRSIPINGVGLQMHISYNWPSKQEIEASTQMIVNRNLKVHYSELDIRANPNNDLTVLTSDRVAAQKAKFMEVVKIYKAIPLKSKYAITLWGIKDDESWIISVYNHIDWPLLFTASFQRKEAYNGFLEGLTN